MAVDFCDYFWGEEHNGWNVLYQNMKQGQTASKELAEFFKERWSIDETYSKSLIKLANKASTNTEKGTCTPIFLVLRQSSEKLSSIHSHTVQRVQDLVKEVVKYNDDLHKKHKGVKDEESQTEEIVKTIQATSGLAQKARETYSQRCQDLEKVRRDGASPKELEKAEAKLRKAHDEYRTLVEKYNSIREEFEKRMTTSCMRFQTVEETHLAQMLQFVQTYISVLQSNHEAMGQIHRDLLSQYSQYSVEKLLDQFALSKHTGLEKPNAMVFEDAGSLGSAVSGQQSPEPADQSKSSAEDGGGGGGSSSGSVLAGGTVVVTKPCRKESGKKLLRERASMFSMSRVTIRSSPSTTTAGSGSRGGCGGNNSGVTVSPVPSITSTKNTSTFTQDPSCSSEVKTTVTTVSTATSRGSVSCGTSNNKPSRRTTSLLNLFVASTSSAGRSEREWSAPPSCDSGGGEGSQDGDGVERGTESLPHSPAKASPAHVTSAPTSPTAADDPSLARTVFRSSKLTLPGGTPVLSFGFLRSRRERKNKEKKVKKKKDPDSSSNKEEKSDNETNDDTGPKTSELITTSVIPTSDKGNASGQPPSVDDEGFSLRPQELKPSGDDNSFDSSSDSDSDGEADKKIHVEIKPISNGSAPMSASVDELRATIEGMSLSPVSFASPRVPPRQISSDGKIKIRYLTLQKTRRTSTDTQDSFSMMKRSNSITQQLNNKTSSADLLGLNLNFGTSESSSKGLLATTAGVDLSLNRPVSPVSKGASSPATSVTSVTSPVLAPPPRADRYAELSDILNETETETPPALPPRTGGGGGSSSRGSTPTPTMAIPRPPSRKALEGPSSRGRQSPSTISGLSRAESVSSLEFRTSSMMGTSRGPSPLTIGLSDTIPLAVAFQELCHAYFRGTDESKCQVKVTGEMMVSFPAGIVGVLANNPAPAQLSFKVNNFAKITNVLPNKQLITMDNDQSTSECGMFNFNMNALTSLLRKQAENNPSASYFNVDMIKYQVNSLNGANASPLQLVSYWKCDDSHTDLRIDYKYNSHAIASPSPLLNVNISVPMDGVVRNMQSKPPGQWLKDQQRAVWKLTELSQHSASGGLGSLRAKFEVAAGPSTPATVSAQFNCEGTTVSGLEFSLVGSGYRVSLVKKRFVSGKYICDADAVLRLRYGSVPS
ncbi:F-BAR domain only protein 2 isoform X2 [Panulirus ornatus]|uniref:F-BAR domain only protein 2 isoform X2 n=1 Tax=Panulirus ornatus TaxID=150431 RepID=UPI003A88D74E